MNEDDRPTLITIPTELERGDAFVVLSVGAGIVLACWWTLQRGVSPWLLAFPVLIAVVWMFTSRSATDVRMVGSIAVFFRNKLGERDVHEWVLAWLHYVKLVHVPVWRANCVALLNSARQHLSSLRHRLSVAIPWLHLPTGSWACLTRSSWYAKLVRLTARMTGRVRHVSSDVGTP